MTFRAIQGDDGTWGVEGDEGVLYDPQFSKVAAEAIVDMENSENPPTDWEETSRRLDRMGVLH
jgi:hypothetical protein